MNKVMLIRNVRPEYFGGGETYQLMLARMLEENGVSPVIVSSSEELLREAEKEKIETVRAPFCKRQNWSGARNLLLPGYLIWQLRLRRWYKELFKKYKPSAINVQSRDDWIAATGIAKKMGIRVLWTDHMDFRSWALTNVNVWYKNIIGKWVLKCARKADAIIVISDFERKSFEKLVRPRKYANLKTIQNGVVDEYEKYEKVKPRKGSFLFLGRVVGYKGVGELIEAFKLVNRKYPDTELNIYGEGEDFARYKALAETDGRIHFYGQTNEPLKVTAENEIFVLPSYREGLSLSLLDAAMMGKKIIASNVDGNPEVVEDMKTGIVVPPKNVQKLAEAMLYMLENPKKAEEMARNVRKKYEEDFNLKEIFAKKMLPLYNNREEEKI